MGDYLILISLGYNIFMKILFLYTKFDAALKEKIELLKAHNAEVSTLSLLEYKLTEDDHITQMQPTSKLEFLEQYSPKLRVINRIFKCKSLLSSLEDYDIIDIYKCEKSALFIVDEISEKCQAFHKDTICKVKNVMISL